MNQTQTSKIYIITCVRLVRTAQLPPSFLSRSIRPNTHHAQQSRRISKKHGGRTGADAAAPAAVDDDDDHVNIAEAHSLSLSLSPPSSPFIHPSARVVAAATTWQPAAAAARLLFSRARVCDYAVICRPDFPAPLPLSKAESEMRRDSAEEFSF